MENKELVKLVNKEMAIELSEQISMEELQEKLSAHINRLIQNNFEQLVNLLYRIDVSEPKIKSLLQIQPGINAGDIIANLIIERQLQKIKSRQQFKTNNDNFTEEEKW
jgi:N-acetylglucosamine kinase-like BadF-type ATPase